MINPFVSFLSKYGRTCDNEAAFFESIYQAANELKVRIPEFEHPKLATLVQIFSNDPRSVVLTGNAGDGKTHLCQTAIKQICDITGQKLPELKDSGEQCIKLKDGKKLIIIKDFTARPITDRAAILDRLARSVFASQPEEYFLIAANEGIFTRQAHETGQERGGSLKRFSEMIEDMINMGHENHNTNQHFALYDLSRFPAFENLDRVMKAVFDHEGWEPCEDCDRKSSTEGARACLIYHNYEKLKNPLVQKRLKELVQMLDWNSDHLTVRHLFGLVVNAILGHRRAPSDEPLIRNCNHQYSRQEFKNSSIRDGAYYQNIFGNNLRRVTPVKPFDNLSRLMVGDETNNRVDKLLVFGDIHENLKEKFAELLPDNDHTFDYKRFRQLQRGYREGDEAVIPEFLDELKAQRRRIYFELPTSYENDFHLCELTAFQASTMYRSKIYEPLMNKKAISPDILRKLVLGLNRIFVGGLIDSTDNVYLTTSGRSSQEKLANLLITQIPHNPDFKTGVRVISSPRGGIGGFSADLEVYASTNSFGKIQLTLSRFEFLIRVSDGVLPASFSMQQYEDFVVFKSQILREYALLFPDTAIALRSFEIRENGSLAAHTIIE